MHLSPAIVEVVFQSIDALTSMIAALQESGSDSYDAGGILTSIEQVLAAGEGRINCESSPPPDPLAKPKSRIAIEQGKPSTTLRMDIERLDHLMYLADQLIINKTQITEIGFAVRDDVANIASDFKHLAGLQQRAAELLKAVRRLEGIAGCIRQTVLDARLVPVGPLFNRFQRVVRDVTRLNGKDVRLDIHGAGDRTG